MQQQVPLSRYLAWESISQILEDLEGRGIFSKQNLGTSLQGRIIDALEFGKGSFKVLIWSQMHGNETTTTKALLEYFKWVCDSGHYESLSDSLNILAIPILNPDGAAAYTRENAAAIDLNRDAQALTQPESQILRKAYEAFKPDLCLNMHGQRSIYGLTGTENPAIVSFLAPAEDKERTVSKTRLKAMHYINLMSAALVEDIGNCIGRYDDSFNANCVGDTFTADGTPTILFEAGQYNLDYRRNNTKTLIIKALKTLFEAISQGGTTPDSQQVLAAYMKLPENNISYYDIIIKAALPGKKANKGDVAVQYKEKLQNGKIVFIPEVDQIGRLARPFAHKVVNDGALKDLLSGLKEDDWPNFIDNYVSKKFRL